MDSISGLRGLKNTHAQLVFHESVFSHVTRILESLESVFQPSSLLMGSP